jgi:hypothetical protein
MLKQTSDEVQPGVRHQRTRLGESILTGRCIRERLMQMPTARIHVRKRRLCHEGRQQAQTAGDLFYRGAQNDHSVCRGHILQGIERYLDLARPPFGLQDPQRQTDSDQRLADGRDYRL